MIESCFQPLQQSLRRSKVCIETYAGHCMLAVKKERMMNGLLTTTHLGILLALLSGILQTTISSIFKSQDFDVGDFFMVKSVIQAFFISIYVLVRQDKMFYCQDSKRLQLLLLASSIPSGLQAGLYFASLEFIPISDCMVYVFSGPVFSSKLVQDDYLNW